MGQRELTARIVAVRARMRVFRFEGVALAERSAAERFNRLTAELKVKLGMSKNGQPSLHGHCCQ